MKTAEDLINMVIIPVREFFGIKPKTTEQLYSAERKSQVKQINVEERCGHIYIVHTTPNGMKQSFYDMPKDATVQDIINYVESARNAAINYNLQSAL